ncbi:MAG: glycosyltransferase family 39 protein [Verrucomicrobiota bacterium]
MSKTSPTSTFFCILLAALILCTAAFLRFNDLEDRPLHFDEATGARIVGYHLDDEQRPFDPKHFHGPLLSTVTTPLARYQKQNSWLELSIAPLRSVTAIAGLLTVAACLFFPARWSLTLAAAAFVATSPLLVYYSRMYIHETLFVFTGILTLLAIAKYIETRRLPWALCFGIAVGLMAATRETVVIALFSWTLAGLAVWLPGRASHNPTEPIRKLLQHQRAFAVAGIACLLTIFAFYSQLGRHPAGFIDFFRTFLVYETTPGHDKAWDYYLKLLIVPQRSMGVLWTEAAVLILAVCGYLLTPRGLARVACRFLLVSGLVMFLVFSLISYKTPWLICLAWLHVCLAAAFGIPGIIHFIPDRSRLLAGILVIGIFGWQSVQAYRAALRWPNDNRNPYAYVPTSPDLVRMTEWVKNDISAHIPRADIKNPDINHTSAVIGSSYWPLPWYLRSLDVGYYHSEDTVPGLTAAPLIFTNGEIPAAGKDSHQWLPRGLRHEVTLWLGIRKDIWEAYQHDE